MRHSLIISMLAAAALVMLSATPQGQAADPWIGTWKVNLAKSNYSPGPAPKTAATVTIESAPNGIRTTIDGADAKGQQTHTESVSAFDGKDTLVDGAPALNTTTALKRIDGRAFEADGKVGGKPTVTTRVVVSADGKTMTATQTGQTSRAKLSRTSSFSTSSSQIQRGAWEDPRPVFVECRPCDICTWRDR